MQEYNNIIICPSILQSFISYQTLLQEYQFQRPLDKKFYKTVFPFYNIRESETLFFVDKTHYLEYNLLLYVFKYQTCDF
jgi:hypothetical protein